MLNRAHVLVLALAALCLLSPRSTTPPQPAIAAQPTAPATSAVAAARLAKLPLRFEANAGQWDARVRFVAHGNGTTLFLTDDGMTLGLRDVRMPAKKAGESREEERQAREKALAASRTAAVTMKLVGATPSAPVGESELVTKSNFLLGNEPTKWRSNVPNFGQVRAKEWLPGVDVVWHGGPDGLEYDLAVAAGTDASKIRFDIGGADALRVTDDGALEITTSAGVLAEQPPRVVQGGKELPTRYRLEGAHRVGFDIEGYDLGRAILIDPVLLYSTYLGGSDGEAARSIAVDSSGSAYVMGTTSSTNFPTTGGAYQTALGGGGNDVFVTKLNASGSALVYSTYLGGNGTDIGYGIAVDSSGSAYVTGFVQSTSFPTTAGAYQTTAGGNKDAFVTKLNASGSALVYSTYLGGSSNDIGYGIAVDSSGSAYVTGQAQSCPTTAGAYQTTFGGGYDAFITKLNASGSALVYSTYLGGSSSEIGVGIAVDSSGSAYVTGYTQGSFPTTAGALQTTFGGSYDAFVTKLNASGSALAYSTYLGGSSDDEGYGIALDSSGSAYVTGDTVSGNFPTTVGVYQTTVGNTFVTKLNISGSALAYSTYIGGSSYDHARGIALDSSGSAYVTGDTEGSFPTTAGAYQTTFGGGFTDAFVTKLNASGSALTYSTYLGGVAEDVGFGIALDSSGSAYVTGYTRGTFPTTGGAYQTTFGGGSDVFIAKLGDPPLILSPASANVTPKASQTFTASGGSGSGYTYSFQTNASGGSINSSTGAYTAGATGSVVDVVKITDSASNTATANVTVGPVVSISPSSPTPPPQGTINFSASGGSNVGFTWSLTTNNSGGSINASTGAYVAGATGNVTDTVGVTDSLGNTASVNVSVGAGIAINPSSPAPPPKGSITFTATGGSGVGYTWSLTTNSSGGSINASTGVYTAGATGSVADTVHVVDSLANVANVTVNVGAGLALSPLSPTTPPRGAIAFTVSGGSGTGYAWSLTTNNSGGSINASTGAYLAGSTGSVTDTVSVNDSLGNTATTSITVGAGVSLSPASPTVAPKGVIDFIASGGSGMGYAWAFVTNSSGGTLNSSTGAYAAGATGSVTDLIKLTDSLGNTVNTSITVGPGVSISPASPTVAPKGAVAFSASGGSGAGYTWAISTNNSGGSINASTGAYTAGATGNVTDTVSVTDSYGNTAQVNVSVGAGISINPASPSTTPKGSVAFVATGGSGVGYAWSVSSNNSGASINASTGAYAAGASGSVTDTVRVQDSLGNVATVTVTVGPGVSISPASPSTAPLGALAFSATGGSGAGYTWSLSTNNSGGSLNASTGAYKAGSTGSVVDTVAVADSLGNTASVTVAVTAALTIAPTSATVAPKGAQAFTASGGSGGNTFTLQTNASGGNISSSSGAYTAGATGSVTDVVKVTDSNGATATATVTVGPGVSISPALPSAPPLGGISFSASGGSGTGWSWSLTSNNSGGSLNASSGAYLAGSTANVADTVKVTDSLGNTASVNVSVGGGLAINPATPTSPPKGGVAFTVTGGSGTGFVWSLQANASGGSINGSTGTYTAGTTGSVTDVVKVVDSLSNSATVSVTVTAGVAIAPPTATVAPGGNVSFSASGGSGTGYAWSLSTNASGGTIAANGTYTAGPTGNVTDTVQLADSLGNTATATVIVTGGSTGDGGLADGGGAGDAALDAMSDAGSSPGGAAEGGGCGCEVVGDGTSPHGLFLLVAAAAITLARRRRRRK